MDDTILTRTRRAEELGAQTHVCQGSLDKLSEGLAKVFFDPDEWQWLLVVLEQSFQEELWEDLVGHGNGQAYRLLESNCPDDYYGGGHPIAYCPWCGEALIVPEEP